MSDDNDDPRCSCGHFRSEHDGAGMTSRESGMVLIEPGHCTGAYHTVHHDYEMDRVEVHCHCQRYHEPSEFHPGFEEITS